MKRQNSQRKTFDILGLTALVVGILLVSTPNTVALVIGILLLVASVGYIAFRILLWRRHREIAKALTCPECGCKGGVHLKLLAGRQMYDTLAYRYVDECIYCDYMSKYKTLIFEESPDLAAAEDAELENAILGDELYTRWFTQKTGLEVRRWDPRYLL